MGMRRNIALDYGTKKKIYLYTHWGAEHLENILVKALDRGKERWDDHSYLARVIFTDMTAGVGTELTGYGLDVFECDSEFKTLEVDLTNRKVNGVSYEEFIKNPNMFAI